MDLKIFLIDFLRERGREGAEERETFYWLPPAGPLLGIELGHVP